MKFKKGDHVQHTYDNHGSTIIVEVLKLNQDKWGHESFHGKVIELRGNAHSFEGNHVGKECYSYASECFTRIEPEINMAEPEDIFFRSLIILEDKLNVLQG